MCIGGQAIQSDPYSSRGGLYWLEGDNLKRNESSGEKLNLQLLKYRR